MYENEKNNWTGERFKQKAKDAAEGKVNKDPDLVTTILSITFYRYPDLNRNRNFLKLLEKYTGIKIILVINESFPFIVYKIHPIYYFKEL